MIAAEHNSFISKELSKLLGFPVTFTSSNNGSNYSYNIMGTTPEIQGYICTFKVTPYPACCGLAIFSCLGFHQYITSKDNKYHKLDRKTQIDLMRLFLNLCKRFMFRTQIHYVAKEKGQADIIEVLTGAGFKDAAEMAAVNKNSGNMLRVLYCNVYEVGEEIVEPEKPEEEELDIDFFEEEEVETEEVS